MASTTEVGNVRKFLDFLGEAEGADYNTVVGGSSFTDYTKHPNIVGLRTKEGPSTAAGRYQITKTTYDDFAGRLGITDFSPESQDKIALAIIQQQGALDDVRQGNFQTAIEKLGNRWASLPSSPYSQPKKSWEWVQARLGDQPVQERPALPAQENTLTNPEEVAPTTAIGQGQLTVTQLQREQEYGGLANSISNLPKALEYGFKNENYVYNFFKEQAAGEADPNFVLGKDLAKQASEGIPSDYHGYLFDAISEQDLWRRRARLIEAQRRQQELGNMGGVGVIGTLTGSLLDLPTLLGFVPILGGGAMVSRTSRVANAVASGLAVGAGNVAAEAALQRYRPTATTDELYFAGLAGLGFGGLAGGLSKPGAVGKLANDLGKEQQAFVDWAAEQARKAQIKELNDAGLELTDLGKKILGDNGQPNRPPDIMDDAASTRREWGEVVVPKGYVFDESMGAWRPPKRAFGEEGGENRFPDAPDQPEPPRIAEYDKNVRSDPNWVPKMPNGTPKKPYSTLKKQLDEIIKGADKELSLLASRLKDLAKNIDDIPVFRATARDLGARNAGGYFPEQHIIAVRQQHNTPNVMLHEIAHAMTVYKLDYGKANPATVHGKLVSQIESLYNQALEQARKEGFKSYYLKNVKEFTAGLYTGNRTDAKAFQDFLAKIKVDGDESMLTKFIDAVRKLLGFDAKDTNAFLKSLALTDKLIEQQLKVRFTKGYGNAPLREVLNAEVDEAGNVVYSKYGVGLENFFARDWVPQKARDLFGKLAGTTQGYKNHSVVQQSAWDQTISLSGGWQTRLAKAYQPAFQEFFQESGAKRMDRAKVFDSWERQVGDYIRGVEGDYHPTVIKTGNEVRKLLRDAVDHINNPGKFNGTTKRGLTQDEVKDAEGNVTLTDGLDYNDNYLPRQFDIPKLKGMVSQFGRETVEGFFERAFKRANPDVSDDLAKDFGRWYIASIEDAKINRSAEFIDDMLKGYDKEALKESLIRVGRMNEEKADAIIAAMFPRQTDRGVLTRNLKRRSVIDEHYAEDIQMPDGTNYNVTLNDFIDTRTFDILNGYFSRTAGAVSLANNVGIYKQSDIGRAILDASEAGFLTNMSESQLNSLRKNLQFTFDRLQGKPVENFTPLNKALETWRAFNVTRLMSLAVFNQVQEMSQIIGTMGWKTTLKAIPELGKMFRDAKTGKVANDILEHLENVTGGAGADIIRRHDFSLRDDWVREVGDTSFNRWLDRADNVMRRGADGVLKYTGMTGLMVQQKRIHAIAVVNHFLEVANGSKKMVFTPERLAWMGLEPTDVDSILSAMKQFQVAPKGDKRLGSVDFDAWNAADPESYAKFIVAFQRESRRVVQENDLASMVPIMGTGLGQTFFQFLNFSLQGWNKSLMFAMNHKDFATLSTVLHGSMFAAVTYMARSQIQMMGMSREEQRAFAEKRLNTKQIVANSFGRIAQVSLLPVLIDSTIAPTPIFSGARTTSNVTDFLGSNPTVSSLNTILALPRRLTRNALSDEYQTTERDVQQYFKLLPLNNAFGISTLLNSIAADYPSQEMVQDR